MGIRKLSVSSGMLINGTTQNQKGKTIDTLKHIFLSINQESALRSFPNNLEFIILM